jgi:hypothetical protein
MRSLSSCVKSTGLDAKTLPVNSKIAKKITPAARDFMKYLLKRR